MHQIVIRILAPQISVFDFVFGQVIDGQFKPGDCNDLPAEILDCVDVSNLLGTQAFVKSTRVSVLTRKILAAGADMLIYPNFIVFNLPENYVTEEKENKE